MVHLPRSFDIYRECLTPMGESFDRLQAEFNRQDINPDHIQLVGRQATKSMLLDKNEISWYLFENDQTTNSDALDTLIAYLRDVMPRSIDKKISLPTEQVDMRPLVSRFRTQQFSLGGNDRVLKSERETAKTYIEEFFELEGKGRKWPVWDYSPELPLLRVINLDTADKVHDILSRYPEIMPPEIVLGPVKIEKSAN